MTILEKIQTLCSQEMQESPRTQVNDQKITDYLNEVSPRVEVQSTMVSARGILGAYGMDGAVILDKLEQAAAINPACRWACKFLGQDTGLDVGHPTTQQMIDLLVSNSILTNEEGNKLKSLAIKVKPYTVVEIEEARNG